MALDPVPQRAREEKFLPGEGLKDARNSPHKFENIKKRKDFYRARKGLKVFSPHLMIQALHRKDQIEYTRIGFVASKKIGNAVQRNYAKRKMRSLVKEILPSFAKKGWDYVFISHPSLLNQQYKSLKNGMIIALKEITTKATRKMDKEL